MGAVIYSDCLQEPCSEELHETMNEVKRVGDIAEPEEWRKVKH